MNDPDDPPQAGIALGGDDPPQAGIAVGGDDPPQAGIALGEDDPPQAGIALGGDDPPQALDDADAVFGPDVPPQAELSNDPADSPEEEEEASVPGAADSSKRFGIRKLLSLDATPLAGAVAPRASASGIELLGSFGLPAPRPSRESLTHVDPLVSTGESPFRFGVPDGASAAALMETFVVPRYLAPAGELLLELLAVGESAQIVHVDCSTGFPDATLLERLPGAELYGCDPSASAIQLAQSKAAAASLSAEYLVSSATSTPFPSGAFTHALTLDLAPEARAGVFSELQRLLAPGGQLLVTLLLRGSAQELTCLIREYAVASDRAELSRSLDLLSAARPTPEMVVGELEAMGFQYVEVEHRRISLSFRSGRDFLEDPVCRMLLFPETERLLRHSLSPALDHVRTAIDRYWSTEPFELVLSLGCVSARRAGN